MNCKAFAQKCIELDPVFVKGYYRLAQVQLKLWEFENGRQTLLLGLKHNPTNKDLWGMMIENERDLKFRNTFQETTISVPEQDYEFFGGLRPGNSLKIPRDSAYFRLKRSALPPYSHKHGQMSYSDEVVKSVFDCFCTGQLKV